jgi:LDH2 family malate/lactate/ureidoglycolate dehydrogenase
MNLETPAGMSLSATRTESLKGFVAEIFSRLGVPPEAARLTAAALVAADVGGLSSHGVALVPIYVERMLAALISPETEPTVLHDAGSPSCSMPATSRALSPTRPCRLVSGRAANETACVTVRNGSHFRQRAPGRARSPRAA